MKILESVGMSRSGHHAITNWLIHNMIGFQIEWKYKMTYASGTKLFVLDEANHDIDLSFKFINDSIDKIGTLFVCYEDTPWDYTIFRKDNTFRGNFSLNFQENYEFDYINRFVTIRDFYDNLISRVIANEKNFSKEFDSKKNFYFETGEKYIERWKNLAKGCVEKKTPYIKFEDWLDNKEIKQDFIHQVLGSNLYEDSNSVHGTKSSFGQDNKKRKNYDVNLIPDDIKKLIRDDNELHYLIGALGYDFRKI